MEICLPFHPSTSPLIRNVLNRADMSLSYELRYNMTAILPDRRPPFDLFLNNPKALMHIELRRTFSSLLHISLQSFVVFPWYFSKGDLLKLEKKTKFSPYEFSKSPKIVVKSKHKFTHGPSFLLAQTRMDTTALKKKAINL